MNLDSIVREAAMRAGVPTDRISLLIQESLELLKDAIARGEEVKIHSLGKFYGKFKPKRSSRSNIPGMAGSMVGPDIILSFSTSKILSKDLVKRSPMGKMGAL